MVLIKELPREQQLLFELEMSCSNNKTNGNWYNFQSFQFHIELFYCQLKQLLLLTRYKCLSFFFARLATYFKFYVGIPDFQMQICQTRSQTKLLLH
jgi:hypothetical protein